MLTKMYAQSMNVMQLLRLTIAALLMGLIGLSATAQAEEESYTKANNDVGNQASLQRGARNFMNYCSGCHSAKFVRYNRLAIDLGLTDDQVKDNLIFNGGKVTDNMTIAMSSSDAKEWFNGRTPPDLSLIARSRGADYLYSFLHAFYLDPSRPTGMNNHVLPNAAMPNVLWELQGLQKAVYEGETTADGKSVDKKFKGMELATQGKLTPEEYDQFVRDTVNFLDYISEPIQLERRDLGIRVLGFLLVLFLLAYALKQEYWKDIK